MGTTHCLHDIMAMETQKPNSFSMLVPSRDQADYSLRGFFDPMADTNLQGTLRGCECRGYSVLKELGPQVSETMLLELNFLLNLCP